MKRRHFLLFAFVSMLAIAGRVAGTVSAGAASAPEGSATQGSLRVINQDTFNLITFSGDTSILFSEPVPATKENLAEAQAFLESRRGGGGTEMMKAIRAALAPSDAQDHIRIVCFMTDGEVGNDMEIISEIQSHPKARIFSFGIGNSVNRFLLDKMAEQGRGEVEYVSLYDDGSAAAKRFYERVRNPLLTDISLDWGGLPVADVYPKLLPDLFGAKPVVLCGRYAQGARGVARLRGKLAGRDWEREIPVLLPDIEPRRNVLATFWARIRINELMSQDYAGLQRGNARADIAGGITQLGLDYRVMTQFTSFVAVEEMTLTDGRGSRRVEVPVELPEGMSREGVSGNSYASNSFARSGPVMLNRSVPAPGYGGRPAAVAPGKGPVPNISLTPGITAQRAGADSAKGKPPSPEELKLKQLLTKLHPLIVAAIERPKAEGDQPPAAEAKFVRDGKAEIQMWLTDTSPEVILQLMHLGFEVVLEPKTAKTVIGRMPVEKLTALAELGVVRYIAPTPIN